jgi:hypothetical protein
VPFTAVGGELLFEVLSQRYERGSTLITSNLPFDEWTSVFGSERLTGALLDRLTHHVHIPEMNGDSFRLTSSRKRQKDKGRQNDLTKVGAGNRLPLRYSRFPAADAVQPQPWGFLFNPTGPFLNRCLARFYPGVDTRGKG